jgi:hypothetical protein
VKPVAGADWSQFGLNQASIEERKRWPDADRDRYMGNLALYAAYAKQYELAVELSADVPMLTSYNSLYISDGDCHPILYAVSDLLKQGKNDEALALVGRVKNDAIALASLARIAGSTGYANEQARSIYQHRVLLLTAAYVKFADQHDEATVRGIDSRLPESLHLYLQRVANPPISPEDVPYFDPAKFLSSSERFSYLIEQNRINEVVQHVEGLLKERSRMDCRNAG